MKNNEEITLIDVLELLRKNLLLILFSALIVALTSYLVSTFVITPKYKASASMIVGTSNQAQVQHPDQSEVDYNKVQANRALVSTYSEIVKSRGIGERVIDRLDLNMSYEEFSKKVSIEPVNDTQIISLTVVDTIPERAKDIANETSEVFKESIQRIMQVDNVQILDGARDPDKPVSPKILRNTAIGFFIGLFIGLLITFMKGFLDTTIKTSETVLRDFGLPVLASIPLMKKGKKGEALHG